jgi:RAB protein geranylgeranyltransferase component A
VIAHIAIIDQKMPNMTLAIPDELHKKMKRHTELKWSDIARQAFEKKINEIEFMDKLLEKSNLSEKDAQRIGHSINSKLRKRINS